MAWTKESCLGVDIGTTSIKIAEIQKTDKGLELINYGILETSGYLERFNTAIHASNLNLFEEEVVNYLNILLKKGNFQTKKAIASLSAFNAFTTLIEMPLMSEADTTKAMTMHVKQYVPMPISSVTLDWVKAGERTDDEGNIKQQLFLMAIPTSLIENYKRIFKKTGLELIALEIEGLSLSRVLAGEEEDILAVDIGSRSTSFLIIQNGMIKFSGQTDFAGASLTQSLSTGLNIATKRAEILKRQKGLSGLNSPMSGSADKELSTQMLPILDVIINEAKRVKDNYEINYKSPIKALVLSGGGANLLGMEKYFTQQIGLPVAKADPFKKIFYSAALEPIKNILGPNLAVAIGLAVRGL